MTDPKRDHMRCDHPIGDDAVALDDGVTAAFDRIDLAPEPEIEGDEGRPVHVWRWTGYLEQPLSVFGYGGGWVAITTDSGTLVTAATAREVAAALLRLADEADAEVAADA